MPTLAELLRTNPHGWGAFPPVDPNQAELRSWNRPEADYYGEQFGPLAGRIAEGVMQGGDVARDVARGLSGIEMAEQGGEAVGRAINEGDPIMGAGGIAQMGLAALPFSGKIGAKAFETAPRMATVLGLAGAAPMAASGVLSPSEAHAADSPAPQQQLYEQRSQINQRLTDAVTRRDANRPRNRLPDARRDPKFTEADNEVKELEAQLSAVDQMIGEENRKNSPEYRLEIEKKAQLQAEEEKKRQANTSVRELYPTASALVPAASGLMAAILGGKIKGSYVNKFNSKMDELVGGWQQATSSAEKALAKGDTLTASRLTREAQGLQDQFQKLSSAGAGGTAAAVGTGAAVGELGQLGPIMLDKARAIPGSELDERVHDEMSDPYGVGMRMLQGAAWGGGPAKAASSYAGRRAATPIGYSAKTDSLASVLREGGMGEAAAARSALKDYQAQEPGSAVAQALMSWQRQSRQPNGQFGPVKSTAKKQSPK